MSTLPNENNPSEISKQAQQAAETRSFQEIAVDTGSAAATKPTELPPSEGVEAFKVLSLVGQCFGDLELLEELGRGGMGLVYKARQKSLDRLVAVKLLLTEQFDEPMRLARFQAEARAAASLTHANIVQVYQVGECPFGHYFSMEYIDGKSLESFIKKGKVSIPAAISVMTVVAEAVHYAHNKGIVHRDLKPANIMIDRSRRPIVMDFGIAKFVGKASSLTHKGVLMGTPAFMAPEQAAGTPEEIGPQTDVYSLGAILYTLLTGQVPYDADTALKTVLKVIGPEMPPPIRQLKPEVPRHLERIVMKCLSKRPGDRFATAHEFAKELRRFRDFKPTPAGESTVAKRKPNVTMVAESIPSVTLVSRKTGKKIRLFEGKTLLGRSSDCEVVLRASDISKQHCEILLDEDGVTVEDLGSANGTFINDKKVRHGTLKHGDVLRLADYEFLVRIKTRKA